MDIVDGGKQNLLCLYHQRYPHLIVTLMCNSSSFDVNRLFVNGRSFTLESAIDFDDTYAMVQRT